LPPCGLSSPAAAPAAPASVAPASVPPASFLLCSFRRAGDCKRR
jgi:hypothetical protein